MRGHNIYFFAEVTKIVPYGSQKSQFKNMVSFDDCSLLKTYAVITVGKEEVSS